MCNDQRKRLTTVSENNEMTFKSATTGCLTNIFIRRQTNEQLSSSNLYMMRINHMYFTSLNASFNTNNDKQGLISISDLNFPYALNNSALVGRNLCNRTGNWHPIEFVVNDPFDKNISLSLTPFNCEFDDAKFNIVYSISFEPMD